MRADVGWLCFDVVQRQTAGTSSMKPTRSQYVSCRNSRLAAKSEAELPEIVTNFQT